MISAAPPSTRIVGAKAGQIPWAREAIVVLRETASRYGATITYADLAEAVQHRSGVHTHAQQRTWLGGVLKLVATACHGRGLPQLISLAVNAQDGRVGQGYDAVRLVAGQPSFENRSERERHAAEARLACYRAYCPSVPENAEPEPAPTRVTAAASVRKAAPVEVRAAVCNGCFIELPLTGGDCPNCD